MKLIVNLQLLELEWNHVKDVKREKPHHSSGWNESNFQPIIIISTTTPMKNQLVNDGQVETLNTFLSTYNETDKYVCVPTNAD